VNYSLRVCVVLILAKIPRFAAVCSMAT